MDDSMPHVPLVLQKWGQNSDVEWVFLMFMSDGLRDAYLDRLMALLSWVLLAIILISALALGANRPVSWSLLAIFVGITFVAHLILDMWKGFSPGVGRITLVATLYLGVLVWAYFQTLPGLPETLHHPVWSLVESNRAAISADPIRGHHLIMRLLCYAMVFWIGLRVSEDVYRAYDVIKVIAVFSTLLAAFGLYALMTGENAILGDLDNGQQLVASFVNRNSYATYAIIGLLANIMCYLHFLDSDLYGSSRSGMRNYLESFFAGSWKYAIGALLCFAAVALTQSRAGAAAAIIGLLAFFICYRVKGKATNWIMVSVLLAIFGFVVFTLTSDLTERLLTTSEENLRFLIYPEMISGISERIWLGHGLGSFLDVFRANVPLDAAAGEWDFAHNTILENVYELGVPAAAVFYLALALIALRMWRGARERQRDRGFACLAFAMIIAVIPQSVFDFSLQMPATAALFAFILGVSWTQSFSGRVAQKRKKKNT